MKKGKFMKNILLVTVLSFAIVGCAEYTGDTTYNDNSGQDLSVSYGEGDVLICSDSNCTYTGETISISDVNNSKSDPLNEDASDLIDSGEVVVGVYDENYSPSECAGAGFFFCSIEQKCLNQPVVSGSCN